jgi:hypothetical protein
MVLKTQLPATYRRTPARLLFLAILSVFLASNRPTQVNPPEAVISNGLIRAKLYLPDKENGYYRGARFDWSGVISSLEYKGHTYFGQWFDTYDPTLHDAIMGPVDEFREPLGFEEISAGGEFVKVGVGTLKRPDGANYSFAKKYELTNPGIWKVNTGSDRVSFSQELKGPRGFSYVYEKVLRLAPDQAMLVIEHHLSNTGSRQIVTSTYNHNFFMIDQEPTGPNLTTTFDFEVEAHGRGFGELVIAERKKVTYLSRVPKGQNVFSADLKKQKGVPVPYAFALENTRTGAGVRVRGDKPIDTLVYWACSTTACPEPYLNLSLKPGESTRWEIRYEFYKNP